MLFGNRNHLIFLKQLFFGSRNVLKTRRQHFSTPAEDQIRAVSPFRVPKSSQCAPSIISGFRLACLDANWVSLRPILGCFSEIGSFRDSFSIDGAYQPCLRVPKWTEFAPSGPCGFRRDLILRLQEISGVVLRSNVRRQQIPEPVLD
jgi:hypothetical protein